VQTNADDGVVDLVDDRRDARRSNARVDPNMLLSCRVAAVRLVGFAALSPPREPRQRVAWAGS